MSKRRESTAFRNNDPWFTFCDVIKLLVCYMIRGYTPRAYRSCRRWKESVLPCMILVAVHNFQQMKHTSELKMLRWMHGKNRKDRIRNEKFWRAAILEDYKMRRDDWNVVKEITQMKVGGKRPRRRPILRWVDRV